MPTKQSKPIDTVIDGDLSQWLPLEYVYEQFVKTYPTFGLKSGRWPLANVKRHHGDELVAQGVVLRLRSGKWQAHETRFAPALVAAMTRKPKAKAKAGAA